MVVYDHRKGFRAVTEGTGIGLIIPFQNICEPLGLLFKILRENDPEMIGPDLFPIKIPRVLTSVVEL
jgi:hypothetical protein